jgi:hypothetical protein
MHLLILSVGRNLGGHLMAFQDSEAAYYAIRLASFFAKMQT